MRKRVQLNGSEITGFIKERQLHAVRALRQSEKIIPRLAIVRSAGNPAVDSYLKIKKNYAEDILVELDIHEANPTNVEQILRDLSKDDLVQGIILQLPFQGIDDIDKVIENITSIKDVDNMRGDSNFDAPTPTAIMWLLAAYNVDLPGKNIVVVGRGRLVGEPLTKLLDSSGIKYTVVDENTKETLKIIAEADILISGVGKPGVIKSKDIKPGAIVVDAGVASDNGVLKGDVEEIARQRDDISITPRIGGVGPLTVAALFENVIKACRQ